MRCSPSRAITYYQALIISAPARAFPRPRGSFGNALSKASQWKICKGFGTSNYQVVKILTTTKSLESEKQWHTPRPFQQGSAPRPLYWGSALRSLAQEVKLFLVDSTPINFSFSWLSNFALFSILTLGWNKLLLLLVENLFLGQIYPFYDLQRIIWLKVSSKVAQGIYELTREMTRGIPSSIPSFLEDLFVRFHSPWFSQAHI